ncbi:hypothetical protein F5Y17DRAFT_430940 [Xylariaceae sp. FL0594]|nr:hypothetical protein F5Y17DRAFT_430940 [Xylariaceae sp. FL0594]
MHSPHHQISLLPPLVRSSVRYASLPPNCTRPWCTKRFISSPSVYHSFATRRSLGENRGRTDRGQIITRPQRPRSTYEITAMPQGSKASSSSAAAAAGKREKKLAEPRPSSSIILLSPTNQVLLLHRVKTSTAFASAHVFPGGNLSDFHDGAVPPHGDPKRHEDSLAYRLGAIRETFEESGILLARDGKSRDGPLLNLPTAERDEARKAIWENKISFRKWLESVGGIPDVDNLIPFTRWITPPQPPKRFTTQMYLYMLPLSTSSDPVVSAAQHEALIPTPDGGAEITTAQFGDVFAWLEKGRRGEITLFPPQHFLLYMLSQFLTGAPSGNATPTSSTSEEVLSAEQHYEAQREKLRVFLNTVPTSSHPKALKHPTSQIPWADKVISPVTLGVRQQQGDRRVILGLHSPGEELKGTDRGGDWERVVLVNFTKAGPVDVEVRGREEVFVEEREVAEKAKEKL